MPGDCGISCDKGEEASKGMVAWLPLTFSCGAECSPEATGPPETMEAGSGDVSDTGHDAGEDSIGAAFGLAATGGSCAAGIAGDEEIEEPGCSFEEIGCAGTGDLETAFCFASRNFSSREPGFDFSVFLDICLSGSIFPFNILGNEHGHKLKQHILFNTMLGRFHAARNASRQKMPKYDQSHMGFLVADCCIMPK